MHFAGKKTKVIFAVALVAVVILLGASWNLYYLRDDSGGFALWTGNEAYLFMGTARRGFRFRFLGYQGAGAQRVARCPCRSFRIGHDSPGISRKPVCGPASELERSGRHFAAALADNAFGFAASAISIPTPSAIASTARSSSAVKASAVAR